MKRCANCGKKLHLFLTPMFKIADGWLCGKCLKKIIGVSSQSYKGRDLTPFNKAHLDELKSPYFHGIICPNCGSVYVQYIGPNQKYDMKRGVLGGVLMGPIGAWLGFFNGKSDYYCNNCHHKFTVKDD